MEDKTTETRNPHKPRDGKDFPHPSRVTVSEDRFMVTGLLPKCPMCPLAEGHKGDHLV